MTTTAPGPRRTRVGLWTILSLAVAIAFTLLLSVLLDSGGKPVFEKTLLQQTLSSIALIGAAFGPSLYANRQDTKIIRHEVKNEHNTNLREEGDSRHGEILQALRLVQKDVGGIRQELRNDREAVRRLQDQLHLLSNANPPKYQ